MMYFVGISVSVKKYSGVVLELAYEFFNVTRKVRFVQRLPRSIGGFMRWIQLKFLWGAGFCLRVRMIFMNCFLLVGGKNSFQNSDNILHRELYTTDLSTWLWKAKVGQGGSVSEVRKSRYPSK